MGALPSVRPAALRAARPGGPQRPGSPPGRQVERRTHGRCPKKHRLSAQCRHLLEDVLSRSRSFPGSLNPNENPAPGDLASHVPGARGPAGTNMDVRPTASGAVVAHDRRERFGDQLADRERFCGGLHPPPDAHFDGDAALERPKSSHIGQVCWQPGPVASEQKLDTAQICRARCSRGQPIFTPGPSEPTRPTPARDDRRHQDSRTGAACRGRSNRDLPAGHRPPAGHDALRRALLLPGPGGTTRRPHRRRVGLAGHGLASPLRADPATTGTRAVDCRDPRPPGLGPRAPFGVPAALWSHRTPRHPGRRPQCPQGHVEGRCRAVHDDARRPRRRGDRHRKGSRQRRQHPFASSSPTGAKPPRRWPAFPMAPWSPA